MGLAETAQLIVDLRLKDGLSAGVPGAKTELAGLEAQANLTANAVDGTSASAQGFGERLEGARPKIREFARAGSELSVVAAVLGNDLQGTLGPLGEFIHIAGDAGLVATAVADLGPAFLRTAANALGLAGASTAAAGGIGETGLAAAAATPALDGFAAAEGTAATAGVGAAGGLAGFSGALAALGPVALAVGGGILAVTLAQDNIAHSLDQATILQNRQLNQIRESLPVYDSLGNVLSGAAQQTDHWHDSMDGATTAENTLLLKTHQLFDAATELASTALPDVITAFGNAQTGAGALGPALAQITTQAQSGAEGVGILTQSLDQLPKSVEVTVITKFLTQGIGATAGIGGGAFAGAAGNIDLPAPSSGSLPSQNSLATQVAAQQAAANKASSAADSAAAKARQRALDLARAYRTDVDDAFKTAQRSSESLFNSLDTRILKQIKNTETLAQKQHDASVQQISDNLKAEITANAAPANAAEAALRQREQSQQRRGLAESAAQAQLAFQQNGDPTKALDLARSVRDAKEALQNFDDAAKIDKLRASETAKDATAEAAAKALTANADKTLADAQRQAALDTAAENARNRDSVAKFERALSALRVADLAAHKTPGAIGTDITALEKRFGIFTDAQGFHHVSDPLVQAIKDITLNAPPVNLNFNPTLSIRIGTRELAAALASQTSPTQSGTVRSGQTQRT